MCSFRFYPVASVKKANFAVWFPCKEPVSGPKLRQLYKDFGSIFTVAKVPFCWNLIRKAFLLHSKDFLVLMIADLLYGIPILAQNWGLIGETNVRYVGVSVIRVKPFYNIIEFFLLFLPFFTVFFFKIAEIVIRYPNISPKLEFNKRE